MDPYLIPRSTLAPPIPESPSIAEAIRAAFTTLSLPLLGLLLLVSVPQLVVELGPRPVVQLTETLWEQSMPSLSSVSLGERLRVRIERVNPRAHLLVLRRVA